MRSSLVIRPSSGVQADVTSSMHGKGLFRCRNTGSGSGLFVIRLAATEVMTSDKTSAVCTVEHRDGALEGSSRSCDDGQENDDPDEAEQLRDLILLEK